MPNRRICASLCLLLALMLMAVLTATAQDDAPVDDPVETNELADLLRMSVDAGYDTVYRENFWLPLRIRVTNDGDPINGKLIVRPETSGRVISNAYSTPVDLPSGGDQVAFLYILARAFPPQVTVELLDDDGVRLLEQRVPIRAIHPNDLLHVVVAGGDAASIPLNDLRVGGFAAHQARWGVNDLPDSPAALEAVDTLWLTNVNTAALTASQQAALREYVLGGGHLLVLGGPNWQETTAGIADLLPLQPDGTTGVDELSALARYLRDDDATLAERTLITTGTLRDGASALIRVEDEDGAEVPLLARWQIGEGTVDFVAADPSLEPLRSWGGTADLWYHLVASRAPIPGWSNGFVDYDEAATAVAILPGIDLLPGVGSMILFLAAYIGLIGPVNYLILSRLNRRGWAWVTIPAFIALFSGLAWSVGFNLRGNDVLVSRLTVVRSWPGEETATADQLIGILSPRRETYTLQAAEDQFLRVMPELERSGSLLGQNITQSTAEIVQTTDFAARNITIDGGIFANFSTTGTVETPPLSGSMTLVVDSDGSRSLQGIVRNDSEDITLQDAVILANGLAYHLDRPLAPGDLITFDEGDLSVEPEAEYPAPSPIELSRELIGLSDIPARNIVALRESLVSRNDVLRPASDDLRDPQSPAAQAYNRRDAFLQSFMRDQFGDPGRAFDVYLVGWSDAEWPRTIDLVDTGWTPIDTTLYITALDVAVEQPAPGQRVTVPPEQFTWSAIERDENDMGGVNDMLLIAETSATFRVMPMREAVLSEVDEMIVHLDRRGSYSTAVEIDLWNWDSGNWDRLELTRNEDILIADPAPYLGPDNSVQIQLFLDSPIGSARIREFYVTQTGSF